jgi:hypothetical protein
LNRNGESGEIIMAENDIAGGMKEPSEEYQKKLFRFLSDILPLGSPEIPSGTPRLRLPEQLAALKEALDLKPGPFKTNPLFKKYTGWEQRSLMEKWLGDRTTTCNEFCTACTTAMGYTGKEGVGRFDIADRLTALGLSHVWVPADSGAQPEYGDIFRLYEVKPDHNGAPLNHMAVSLWVDGTDWYTVESGQGGPGKGYDSLLRKKRVWKPSALRGWVSMKALLAASNPVPSWLGGWWEVDEGPYDTYYYYFGAGGKVTCTSIRPASYTAPPVATPLVGSLQMTTMYSLSVLWRSTDPPEVFQLSSQDAAKRRFQMTGKTGRGVVLDATRILGANAFA